MTRRIWQIFTTIFWSVKIGTLMRYFCLKQKMHELKIYRGVMCNETEEWWKIWKGIGLSFQNWHNEFDKFWLEHLKASKFYTLMGCFWLKYMMFTLKRYRGVIFHDAGEWCKIWRKTDLWNRNWHEEPGKISPEHYRKPQNWDFDGIHLSKVEIMCS